MARLGLDRYPTLLAEWHPTKNGELTPLSPRIARRKVWWLCSCGTEWEATPGTRLMSAAKRGPGKCNLCRKADRRGQSPAIAKTYLAAEWHPIKNGELDPAKVKASSKLDVWWRCNAGHEWHAKPSCRWIKGGGPGCGICARVKQSITEIRPDLARDWHPANTVLPEKTSTHSKGRFLWRCSTCAHEWTATPLSRAMSKVASLSCPCCLKTLATEGNPNALAKLARGAQPEDERQHVSNDDVLEKLWHSTKNSSAKHGRALIGSKALYWWLCPAGHEWRADPSTARDGCSLCRDLALHADAWRPLKEWWDVETSGPPPLHEAPLTRKTLAWKCPQGHRFKATAGRLVRKGCRACVVVAPKRPSIDISCYSTLVEEYAGDAGPSTAIAESHVHWRCKTCSFQWRAPVKSRIKHIERPGRKNSECPRCQSLGSRFPTLAAEWHPTKNRELTPYDVLPMSNQDAWWRCAKDHEWEAPPVSRVGKITYRRYDRTHTPGSRHGKVGDLLPKGCPVCTTGWGWTLEAIRDFVKGLLPWISTLSPAEMAVLFEQNGFSRGCHSRGIAEAIVKGVSKADLEAYVRGERSAATFQEEELPEASPALGPARTPNVTPRDRLPRPTAAGILRSSTAVRLSDEAAAQALLEARKARIWTTAYHDEAAALAEVLAFEGDDYANRIRDAFLSEYRATRAIQTPPGYSFMVLGRATLPNLMQLHTVWKVRQARRAGNWSDTGAGKSNAAILASRVIEGIHLTLIVCPNNVVETWSSALLQMFPDSDVVTKTLSPSWRPASQHRYLILNYEVFQTRTPVFEPDFIVLDEVQLVKQRWDDQTSHRREFLDSYLHMLETCKQPYVLSMSATPVINNLREGKSILELTLGRDVEGPISATTNHCLRQHLQFVEAGVRWVPEFDLQFKETVVDAACDSSIPEILALPRSSSTLDLEQVLTRARLPVILDNLRPKTLIYTYNVEGITGLLHRHVASAGWITGSYTGHDKRGLEGFLYGDVDVLIASQAIVLGIDGLQDVCNRIVINVLPWTYAEYKQLKGRIFRQGQQRETTIVIPVVSATVGGVRWSWDEAKLNRIRFKQTIGDAVLDGTLPQGRLQTVADAFSNAMKWLRRLEGELRKTGAPEADKVADPEFSKFCAA